MDDVLQKTMGPASKSNGFLATAMTMKTAASDLAVAVVIRNVLPLNDVCRTVGHHECSHPLLSIATTLRHHTRYLQAQKFGGFLANLEVDVDTNKTT